MAIKIEKEPMALFGVDNGDGWYRGRDSGGWDYALDSGSGYEGY